MVQKYLLVSSRIRINPLPGQSFQAEVTGPKTLFYKHATRRFRDRAPHKKYKARHATGVRLYRFPSRKFRLPPLINRDWRSPPAAVLSYRIPKRDNDNRLAPAGKRSYNTRLSRRMQAPRSPWDAPDRSVYIANCDTPASRSPPAPSPKSNWKPLGSADRDRSFPTPPPFDSLRKKHAIWQNNRLRL